MTATKTLCAAAGLTLEAAAKKARLHPRYLAHCVNHGCRHEDTIRRLSRILQCEESVFIWGHKRWKSTFGRKGDAVESEPIDPLPVTPRDRQRHILKLM